MRSENIVTGFRIDMGGAQKKIGVKEPDWRPYIVALETGSPAMRANSLWRQEAISERLWIGSGFNFSTSHDDENTIHETLTRMDAAAAKVAAAFASSDPQSFLCGNMIEPVFQICKK